MKAPTPQAGDPGARAVTLITQVVPPLVGTAAIVPGARLREDLGLDSLAMVELAARLCEDAGAEPDYDAEEFAAVLTVADVQAFHRALCGGPPAVTAGAPPTGALDRLVALLTEVGGESVDTGRIVPSAPLRDLGLDSLTLVRFFARIEEHFAFEWDEDVAPQTFATLQTLARHVDTYVTPPAAPGRAVSRTPAS